MLLDALDPGDDREATVAVAGPAALLVANLHQIGERKDDPGRLVDRDAHDIYRLFVATDAAAVATRLVELADDPFCAAATRTAIDYLREPFGGPDALGPTMAGRAELLIGDPVVTGASAAVLAADVIQAIDQ